MEKRCNRSDMKREMPPNNLQNLSKLRLPCYTACPRIQFAAQAAHLQTRLGLKRPRCPCYPPCDYYGDEYQGGIG